jgi:ribosomal protein L24E
MPTILKEKIVRARKAHRCDYCGETIEKGEPYNTASLVNDGDMYQWKAHVKCQHIASRLYRYIDPDDYGMTSDDFEEGCSNFCRHFICPHCNQMISETEDCSEDQNYCLDKIYNFLQTHELKKTGNWCGSWVAEEIKENTIV